uniref:Glycosyl hydrolase family 13 catalytic domain-containing protein n=1 Tax=Megaselia scalaris TaxID=36166 RepID=T1GX60_MEGSC
MGCNTNSTVYDDYSRDPARTPFHWDSTFNAGFSTAPKTWLPVASTYTALNVEAESNANGNSHLKIYKELIKLRSRKVMKNGDYRYRANNNVFILKRFISGVEIVVLLGNMGDHNEYINLTEVDPSIPANLEILIVSMNSEKVVGTTLNTKSVQLKPSEAIVFG